MGRTFVVINIDTNSCSTELFKFIYLHSLTLLTGMSQSSFLQTTYTSHVVRTFFDVRDTSNTDRAWARGITNVVFKENVMLCTSQIAAHIIYCVMCVYV